VSVRWDGMIEFRRWLGRLPAELQRQATPLAERAAAATEQAARQGYPTRSGDLVGGLSTTKGHAGEYGVSVVVVSAARYAGTYDSGSEGPRQTRRGINRGIAPAGRVFIPAAERARAEMVQGMRALVIAHGFEVQG
jgi:hypothetical protein